RCRELVYLDEVPVVVDGDGKRDLRDADGRPGQMADHPHTRVGQPALDPADVENRHARRGAVVAQVSEEERVLVVADVESVDVESTRDEDRYRQHRVGYVDRRERPAPGRADPVGAAIG